MNFCAGFRRASHKSMSNKQGIINQPMDEFRTANECNRDFSPTSRLKGKRVASPKCTQHAGSFSTPIAGPLCCVNGVQLGFSLLGRDTEYHAITGVAHPAKCCRSVNHTLAIDNDSSKRK